MKCKGAGAGSGSCYCVCVPFNVWAAERGVLAQASPGWTFLTWAMYFRQGRFACSSPIRSLSMVRTYPAVVLGVLASVGWLGYAAPAVQAVVVSTSRETTTAPEDDFGWGNVGIMRNATAIYLGDRWVLSASHVGIGDVSFPETGTFSVDTDSVYQFSNAKGSGMTKPADLVLFQLNEDPGLPPLRISSVTPTVGTEVWVVGHGLNAEDTMTYWDVTQRGATWTWTETAPPGDYSGFKTSGAGVIRWGTNLIEDDESFKNEFDDDILTKLSTTTTQTLTMLTEFDSDESNSDDDVLTANGSTATVYESQAVLADSGGGLFVKSGTAWELAGTILSVEGHRDQPDVTRNAIFGNLTYYADLATYIDQIERRVVFGDFDDDQTLTVADVDALIEAINSPEVELRFDLNHDGQITDADLDVWVDDLYGTYLGDANLDGEFDTGDLIMVFQAGGYEDDVFANSTWSTGDWDGDLEFNTSDFVAALQEGGFETGPRPDASVSARAAVVPEPSSLVLASISIWGVISVFRRSLSPPSASP